MNNPLKQCNPENAETFFNHLTASAAADRCYDCPVMLQCRDIARTEGHLYGVWGGETADERRDWLVQNHPDPDVRREAQAETDRIERQRALGRFNSARRRAEKKGVPLEQAPPPSIPVNGGSALQKERARKRAQRARELLDGGATLNEIAAELGTTRRSVQRYLSAKYDPIAA